MITEVLKPSPLLSQARELLDQLVKNFKNDEVLKKCLRQELPIHVQRLLEKKVLHKISNNRQLIEVLIYFKMLIDIEDKENSKLVLEIEHMKKVVNEVGKIKKEGELYELIKAARGNGSEVTISLTLPNSPRE